MGGNEHISGYWRPVRQQKHKWGVCTLIQTYLCLCACLAGSLTDQKKTSYTNCILIDLSEHMTI